MGDSRGGARLTTALGRIRAVGPRRRVAWKAIPVREFRRGLDCPGGDVSDCHSAAAGDQGRRGGLTLSPRWSRRIGPKLSGRLMAPSTKESNTASYSLAQKGLAMRGKSAG